MKKLKLKKISVETAESFSSIIEKIDQKGIVGGSVSQQPTKKHSSATPGTNGCMTNVSSCWCTCCDNV